MVLVEYMRTFAVVSSDEPVAHKYEYGTSARMLKRYCGGASRPHAGLHHTPGQALRLHAGLHPTPQCKP